MTRKRRKVDIKKLLLKYVRIRTYIHTTIYKHIPPYIHAFIYTSIHTGPPYAVSEVYVSLFTPPPPSSP